MDDDYFTIGRRHTDLGGGLREATVQLAGEFDLGARDELRAELLDVIETGLPHRVVVDLAEVTFIDSEALSAIIDGYLAAQPPGIEFQLANAQGIVRRVLELARISGLLA